jgi:hypothetical protein
MAEGMACRGFGDSRREHGSPYGPLDDGLVEKMSPSLARVSVNIVSGSREDPLPAPLACRVGVFRAQRIRELYEAGAVPEVARVQLTHLLEVRRKRLEKPVGEQRHSILLSLPVANRQLPALEIDVLHPQSTAFHNAQTGAVHE